MVRMVDDLFELSRIHAGVLRIEPEPVARRRPGQRGDRRGRPGRPGPQRPARRLGRGGHRGHRRPGGALPGGLEPGHERDPPHAGRRGRRDPRPGGAGRGRAQRHRRVRRHRRGRHGAGLRRRLAGGARPHPGPGATRRAGARGRLGLAIVKGIVEAHRGRVGVENVDAGDVPVGCRFRVRCRRAGGAGSWPARVPGTEAVVRHGGSA